MQQHPGKPRLVLNTGRRKLSRIPAAYLSAFPCQFQHPVVLKELRLCLKYGAAQPIKRSQHLLLLIFRDGRSQERDGQHALATAKQSSAILPRFYGNTQGSAGTHINLRAARTLFSGQRSAFLPPPSPAPICAWCGYLLPTNSPDPKADDISGRAFADTGKPCGYPSR